MAGVLTFENVSRRSLQHWVSIQHSLYRAGVLTEKRRELLQAAGFTWARCVFLCIYVLFICMYLYVYVCMYWEWCVSGVFLVLFAYNCLPAPAQWIHTRTSKYTHTRARARTHTHTHTHIYAYVHTAINSGSGNNFWSRLLDTCVDLRFIYMYIVYI